MPSTADAAGTAETAERSDAADPAETATDDAADDWYATRWGRIFYWTVVSATLLAVVISVSQVGIAMQIPASVYLFGFLGAAVYAFAHFAKQFERAGRYRLKILSRTVAVLPLSAGVFLLAGVFVDPPGSMATLGESALDSTERLVGGLVFVAGIYVSTTLKALDASPNGRLAIPEPTGIGRRHWTTIQNRTGKIDAAVSLPSFYLFLSLIAPQLGSFARFAYGMDLSSNH